MFRRMGHLVPPRLLQMRDRPPAAISSAQQPIKRGDTDGVRVERMTDPRSVLSSYIVFKVNQHASRRFMENPRVQDHLRTPERSTSSEIATTQRRRTLAWQSLPHGLQSMKLVAILVAVARLVHVSLSTSQHLSDPKRVEARSAAACRVAVCVSGDVRSFLDPTVHRSFRRHVVEAIEGDGCIVDVFAYASLGFEEMFKEKVRCLVCALKVHITNKSGL